MSVPGSESNSHPPAASASSGDESTTGRRLVAVGLALATILALAPGLAAADTRMGGTVVVAEDETVGDLTVTGGTVTVRGTVDGDIEAYGGDVRIEDGATVSGIVRAYGGTVRIDGEVGENVLVYAGSTTLGERGSVAGSFGAVGGSVVIAGAVGGDANVVAGTVTLAETATVEGDLTYRGDLVDDGAAVGGTIQPAEELALFPADALSTAFRVVMVFSDLLLGALLLYALPGFSRRASREAIDDPAGTALRGLAAVVAVTAVALLFGITIVGLPIAVAILLLGAVLAWVAAVYGRYVVGVWALSYTERESEYLALIVGVIAVTLLGLVPVVGWGVRAVVLLLGAGVLVAGGRRLRDRLRESEGRPGRRSGDEPGPL